MIDIDDDINLDDISDEIDDISLIFGVNWWYLMIDIDDNYTSLIVWCFGWNWWYN